MITRKLILFLGGLLAVLGLLLTSLTFKHTQDTSLKRNITLILSDEIARSGGLVVLQIIEVDSATGTAEAPVHNVMVASPVTIANIPIRRGEDYAYRFDRPDKGRIETNRFSVGTTTLPDGIGQTTLLYHHIGESPDWPLSLSRRIASVLEVGAAHNCRAQADILVCDARSVLSGDMPE